MNFDCIIANPPYGKIVREVTRNVIEQNPDSNYAMLGTRSMFKPFYSDTLACAFVQIGRYELGSNTKLDWGVEQAILLATNGWTEVVDNRKKGQTRNAHLVQMSCADTLGAAATHRRSTTLVQMSQGQIPQEAYTRPRNETVINKSVDVKLRSSYVYVSFETFEEACECAIDIISWTDPTDSHYRCVRWGFVQELRAHEKSRKS